MSLAGLKKQFNKANQYLSETVGTAEPTKLDEDYHALEKRVDLTNDLVEELITGTREYLQPNPATRARMATAGAISKMRGTSKNMPYPQCEGLLGETMIKYGKALGEENSFGTSLIDCGEAYRAMADVKYALEDSVKQNFLDPLAHLQANDLKEVMHHRKKLQGRRLDYDCKKRGKYRDDEMIQAEEKLEESKKLAEQSMFNVLENDVEQISQLNALVDAQLDFHRQTTDILERLQEKLKSRLHEAADRPRFDHVPKPALPNKSPSRSRSPVPDTPNMPTYPGLNTSGESGPGTKQDPWSVGGGGGGGHEWNTPPPAYNAVTNGTQMKSSPKTPCVKAIYDFEAENEGELSFKDGQIINLISKIDENWFEGSLPNGNAGFFPVTYVQVVVPLP